MKWESSSALCGKVRSLEARFDESLDTVSEGTIVFKEAMPTYLESGSQSEKVRLSHDGELKLLIAARQIPSPSTGDCG